VEYNGISGLFSNILTVLALSELGVGNVMNYSLYSALKENDIEKVISLVKYFKKIYFCIALAISSFGLALVPFLKYIINSNLPLSELKIYYLLFLANSVSSYFVYYKITVIIADQNNYINSICEIVATTIMHLTQIVYLLLVKDFLGFLIIQVLCTVLKNVFMNYIANIKYPYLKNLNSQDNILSENEKGKIVDNIKSTFIYKIAAVILNNTDNILISIIVGTSFVGYYSNYYLIVSYITTFVSIFITGITASLGNLNSENNNEASFKMFNVLGLIFSFIGTVSVCCMVNCFQPFIEIWIGKEHVMNFSWVIVISLNFFLATIMNPIWMFRETMGLFSQVRFVLLITAGLNIIFSIILGNLFGVPGVLSATFIARLLSQYWYEPIIIFRKFKKSVLHFYFKQFKQLFVMVLAVLISMAICSILGDSLLDIIIRGIISSFIAFCAVYLSNYNTDAMYQLNYRYVLPLIKKSFNKLKRHK
jgi:O-antigen/teichoic acid export membrane protein